MERTLRSSGRHPLRVLKVRPPSPAKANPSVEGDSMASKRVATARGHQLSSEARREEMSVIFSSLLQNNNNQKDLPISSNPEEEMSVTVSFQVKKLICLPISKSRALDKEKVKMSPVLLVKKRNLRLYRTIKSQMESFLLFQILIRRVWIIW
jgi:hypothetical protein